MARPIRVEFPGAAYHVTARGNERRKTFRDDEDRQRFLRTLEEAVAGHDLRVHGFCLMPNHYHLLVEAPRGNLSRAIGWLQTTCTVRFMKSLFALSLLGSLLFAGCTTNDFRVVEALRTGMTRTEARSTIESFSFPRSQTCARPPEGWPQTDNTFTDLPGRAFQVEQELRTVVASTDCYPAGHGLLGAGQLFLFYDSQNKLVRFYRYQIN